jgi:hypothetical protein
LFQKQRKARAWLEVVASASVHVGAPFASLFSLHSEHARIYIHFCGAIHSAPVQLKALTLALSLAAHTRRTINRAARRAGLSLSISFTRASQVSPLGLWSLPASLKVAHLKSKAALVLSTPAEKRPWLFFFARGASSFRERNFGFALSRQYVCTKWKTFHHANSSSSTFM